MPGAGAGARLVVVEVPVDGEAVAADAPLLAGGAGAAPATHAHIAPCPQQLRRLLWLQPHSTWKSQDGVKGMDGQTLASDSRVAGAEITSLLCFGATGNQRGPGPTFP